MSRKTKKKKLMSELRRKEQLIKWLSQERSFIESKKDKGKKDTSSTRLKMTPKKQVKPKATKQLATLDYSWVISDLKRIIILSLLAFSLEAVVYWALIVK